jgi:hypothetical protein
VIYVKNAIFRGQAALEYLTTYGWALLIRFIVIAALMVIAPVSTPATCRFDQIGFSCPIPSINTNGKLFMRISNSNNNDINIVGIKCTDNRVNTPPTAAQWGSAVSLLLSRQSEVDLTTNNIICTRSDGSHTFVTAEEFTGRLWIKYKNTEDPGSYPNRTASAVISTKVA